MFGYCEGSVLMFRTESGVVPGRVRRGTRVVQRPREEPRFTHPRRRARAKHSIEERHVAEAFVLVFRPRHERVGAQLERTAHPSRPSRVPRRFLASNAARKSAGQEIEVQRLAVPTGGLRILLRDRKSTRLNSSHGYISYAVFCLK